MQKWCFACLCVLLGYVRWIYNIHIVCFSLHLFIVFFFWSFENIELQRLTDDNIFVSVLYLLGRCSGCGRYTGETSEGNRGKRLYRGHKKVTKGQPDSERLLRSKCEDHNFILRLTVFNHALIETNYLIFSDHNICFDACIWRIS